MQVHFYFHDDFDGISSGAVMLDFLQSRGDEIISFNRVNYLPSLKSHWPDDEFKGPFIIVDFLYHPRASWWFDHHLTTFTLPDWKDNFRPDNNHFWDVNFKSCCGMMAAHFVKEFGYCPPAHIKELTKWADIVDSAGYDSAKQVIEAESLALKLNLALLSLEEKENAISRKFIIKQLAKAEISELLKIPAMSERIKHLLNETEKSKKIFPSISRFDKKVLFVDATKTAIPISRFLGYYLNPEAFYTVTIERIPGGYHLNVGKNPWNKNHEINLGRLMSQYGGGGHAGVGAVERENKEEVLKVAGEIVEYLNKPRSENSK